MKMPRRIAKFGKDEIILPQQRDLNDNPIVYCSLRNRHAGGSNASPFEQQVVKN